MSDQEVTLYASGPLYWYYLRNGVPAPFERLVKTGNLPAMPEKHDGILDARSQYFKCVLLTSEGDRQVVIMDNTFDGFGITPKQALSLRDWLIQESQELERLAKEQCE